MIMDNLREGLIPDIDSEHDFNTAVGRLNLLVAMGSSSVAGLALACILYQDRQIHDLKERKVAAEALLREFAGEAAYFECLGAALSDPASGNERVPDPNCPRCGGTGEVTDIDSWDPSNVYWCPRCCPRPDPAPGG